MNDHLLHASGTRRDPKDFIIPALDVESAAEARSLIAALSPVCDLFKVGKHFILDSDWSTFLHQEFGGESTKSLFLDLKDFDTTESSRLFARQVYAYNVAVSFFTVHAIRQTIEAALSERRIGTSILAVPLLTSYGSAQLKEVYGWDDVNDGSVTEFVLQRAELALDLGVDGFVCSAQEVKPLRQRFGSEFFIVVPGFHSDHARSGSPAQAVQDGADYVVIGRRIILASDPRAAFEEVADEIGRVI